MDALVGASGAPPSIAFRCAVPAAPLRPFVQFYWHLDAPPTAIAPPERFLPGASVIVVFGLGNAPARYHIGSDCRALPRSYAKGIVDRVVTLSPQRGLRNFGIAFVPGAARPFLGVPAGALCGAFVPTADLGLADLEDPIAQAASFEARCAVADRFLIGRLAQHAPSVDPRAVALVGRLSAGAPFRLSSWAPEIGLSERQIRRLFDEHVGASPVRVARIIRARRALQHIRGGGSFAEVAFRHGYADQAHLARELRALLGATATELRRPPGGAAGLFSAAV